MLFLTHRSPADAHQSVTSTLALTAEERTRSHYRFETEDAQVVFLRLPRGTVLQDGDLLQDGEGLVRIRVLAKPEPVLTVEAATPLDLLRAAYHLGNRHVALEISATYVRLLPDPILQEMLIHLGVQVREEVTPFHPEPGAYGQGHSHAHP